MSNPPPALILASTSRYRAELLQRLGLPFTCLRPEVDETATPGEAPQALALRLACAKAAAIAATRPSAVVIGADQVAALDGGVLGKPGSRERAIAQLRAQSGHSVEFLTAVAVLSPALGTQTHVDRTRVCFRQLETAEIERYVDAEPALDCAGSFKCEGLGISLFSAIESEDPTALIGLPLIALRAMLAAAGLRCP